MSERINVIEKFIDISESYLKTEQKEECIVITNEKLKDFRKIINVTEKEELKKIYRDELTLWIINKIEQKEFIPVIDRVNINPVREIQKEIKIFDPTLSDQTKKENKPELISINQIKLKNK